MKQTRADRGGRPWVIQPELTEGCSMSYGSGPGGLCQFCGITAIRSGPGNYKFMTMGIATQLVTQIKDFCPKARVEFAMRGEPLMNPDHLDIFRIFRINLPDTSLMVTTNGDTIRSPSTRPGRMQDQLEKIFDAGINLVLLDTYYPKERRDALQAEARSLTNITVIDFFDEWAGEGKSPYSNHHKTKRTVVLMDDLLARDGEHSSRVVKNHAGSNLMKPVQLGSEFPLKRNCARPFREMTVAWNGDVTLCCDDWRKEYIIDNVTVSTLAEIWVNPRFEAARARLLQKDRAFGPCATCDAPMAPRTGLLPTYDPPTQEQITLTQRTMTKKRPLWAGEAVRTPVRPT